MKIVHISMADFNGAGLCAYRICKAQRAMGMDSRMVVLKKKHKDDFIETYGGFTYFLYSILRKIKKLLRIPDDFNTCRELGKLHNGVYTLPVSHIDLTRVKIIREADIIHLHWVGNFLDYRTFFETFKKKPVVATLHDENLLYGLANIEKQLLPDNQLERKYYRLKFNEIQSWTNSERCSSQRWASVSMPTTKCFPRLRNELSIIWLTVASFDLSQSWKLANVWDCAKMTWCLLSVHVTSMSREKVLMSFPRHCCTLILITKLLQ